MPWCGPSSATPAKRTCAGEPARRRTAQAGGGRRARIGVARGPRSRGRARDTENPASRDRLAAGVARPPPDGDGGPHDHRQSSRAVPGSGPLPRQRRADRARPTPHIGQAALGAPARGRGHGDAGRGLGLLARHVRGVAGPLSPCDGRRRRRGAAGVVPDRGRAGRQAFLLQRARQRARPVGAERTGRGRGDAAAVSW